MITISKSQVTVMNIQYVCRVRKQIEERGLSLEITDGRYRVDPTSSVLQSVERLYDVLI